MKIKTGILFGLILLLLQGCISTNRLTTINFQQNYTGDDEKSPFRHVLVHQSDSVSKLICEVDYSKLKYKQEKAGKPYLAKFRIAYQVYPEIKSNKITDSASYHFRDSLHFATYKHDTRQIPIKIPDSTISFLNIRFTDLQAGKSYEYFKEVHKTPSDKYNFLVKNSSGSIHYQTYKRFYNKYRFEYRGDNTHPMKATLYHTNEDQIALPPFSLLPPDHQPAKAKDNLRIENGVIDLKGRMGLLVVQNGRETGGGYPFLSRSLSFPQTENYEEKIKTLRYITTNEEFLALSAAKVPEKAYTQFWSSAAGDYDRAYSKMDQYEKRVRLANTCFSIVTEGWKSDRGMIYIIFGVPGKVLKYEGQEKWLYPNLQGKTLEFVFKRKDSPFGIKEYYLERKEAYRIPWYGKVENWKN